MHFYCLGMSLVLLMVSMHVTYEPYMHGALYFFCFWFLLFLIWWMHAYNAVLVLDVYWLSPFENQLLKLKCWDNKRKLNWTDQNRGNLLTFPVGWSRTKAKDLFSGLRGRPSLGETSYIQYCGQEHREVKNRDTGCMVALLQKKLMMQQL